MTAAFAAGLCAVVVLLVASVARPAWRPHDYRSDASPEIAVRGDVATGRTILVRAASGYGVALVLVGASFLLFALVTLAAALGG